MELSEVIKRKEILEKTIQKEIEQFQLDTKLTVKEIEFFRGIPYTGGFNSMPNISIIVKVEI